MKDYPPAEQIYRHGVWFVLGLGSLAGPYALTMSLVGKTFGALQSHVPKKTSGLVSMRAERIFTGVTIGVVLGFMADISNGSALWGYRLGDLKIPSVMRPQYAPQARPLIIRAADEELPKLRR